MSPPKNPEMSANRFVGELTQSQYAKLIERGRKEDEMLNSHEQEFDKEDDVALLKNFWFMII